MLTTAIPTVLAHAAHAAHAGHADHGTADLPASLAFAVAPALLVFAALLVRKRDAITASVCLFSAVAAQLHALVTGEHFQEHVAFGAVFMVVTLLQIG